jgi:hypothetical protein
MELIDAAASLRTPLIILPILDFKQQYKVELFVA